MEASPISPSPNPGRLTPQHHADKAAMRSKPPNTPVQPFSTFSIRQSPSLTIALPYLTTSSAPAMSLLTQITRALLMFHGFVNIAQGVYCIVSPRGYEALAGGMFASAPEKALRSIGKPSFQLDSAYTSAVRLLKRSRTGTVCSGCLG